MALFFPGTTSCLLCTKTIERTHTVVLFPAFLGNKHPLHLFSDGAFHEACFVNDPRSNEVKSVYSAFKNVWATRPKVPVDSLEAKAWGREAFKDFGH
jgi:hypothetical protein